jgi:hypothetical protein
LPNANASAAKRARSRDTSSEGTRANWG